MKEIKNGNFKGERALFDIHNALIIDSVFCDGESPLKESSHLKIYNTVFKWKYPLWYANNIVCENVSLENDARSGIWYTKNLLMNNSSIEAPKTFRYAKNITLNNCELSNAQETFWNCSKINLIGCKVKGDYFGLNSKNIKALNLFIDGNYAFDGGENIDISDSILLSKDSFWNAENVVVRNSTIRGEYIGWNSKNLKFINCTIESHQGFCYIDGLTLENCKLENTDLAFEFCKNISIDVSSHIDSIKNPLSGLIKAYSIGEVILDSKYTKNGSVKVIVNEKI